MKYLWSDWFYASLIFCCFLPVTAHAGIGDGYSWIGDQSSLLDCSNADSDFERIYDYEYEEKGWSCNGDCQTGSPECPTGKNASMDQWHDFKTWSPLTDRTY